MFYPFKMLIFTAESKIITMKIQTIRKCILSAGIVFLCSSMYARENQNITKDRYNIAVLGVYDYSRTYANRGGADLAVHMPFCPYIEADAGFEYLGPQILSGTLIARPKLPLKVGELFLDAAAHLRAFNSSGAGTFVLAASLGYRMDYVSVQLGVQRTVLHSFQEVPEGEGKDVVEPLNLVFRLAFNVRPSTSPWNISLGAGNFNLYQYERLYYPIFFLGGHVDIARHLSLQAEVDLKPSGMFNMTTDFNELTARAGLTYCF